MGRGGFGALRSSPEMRKLGGFALLAHTTGQRQQ